MADTRASGVPGVLAERGGKGGAWVACVLLGVPENIFR